MSDILAEWVHPVEWGKVRELARAVHDPGATQEPPVPPPTFPVVLNASFIERMVLDILKLDRARTVHGEQEYEYLRPLVPGDVVRCRARIASDTVKQGKRGGSMRIVVSEIEMSDAATGEIIGYERSTAIETAAAT
ncbi:MAG: MaoC family dehydratase N-terminal domain-containing protein [Hyphomicrobiaceae bacterium]